MRQRHLITTAVVTGALLTGAPAAGAAVTLLPQDIDALPKAGAVESGQVTVKLSASAKRLKLSGAGEVSVKGGSLSLLADPEAEVWIDPTSMRGSVGIDGSLSIRGSKGTAKLTKITFSPGVKKNVTAKLGSKTVTLGKLTGGSAKFSKQADGVLSNAKFSLSAAGAKAINKVTGGGVRSGSFGTVKIDVTGRELPLDSGVAKMTLDPGILQLIQQNGYELSAVAPATREGNVITIPMTGGAFDPQELTGRLSFDKAAKVHFANAATGKQIDLFKFAAAVGFGQNDLYAAVNESVTPVLGVLDLSNVEAGLDGKTFHATGAKVTISKVAVSVLKQSFGVTVAQGAALGTVDLTGTISGTF
ncbi:MAG: hypothetical protein J7513_08990 [Solirubrobacteraceae bacterium]|nr:hypothetical protein [Solirubrobacteraceae bacterium]